MTGPDFGPVGACEGAVRFVVWLVLVHDGQQELSYRDRLPRQLFGNVRLIAPDRRSGTVGPRRSRVVGGRKRCAHGRAVIGTVHEPISHDGPYVFPIRIINFSTSDSTNDLASLTEDLVAGDLERFSIFRKEAHTK